jgi:hypothetical protein
MEEDLEMFICHQWDGTFQKWNLWNINHMYLQRIFKCSGLKPKKKMICNHFGHFVHRFKLVLQEVATFKLGHNKMKAVASMFEQLVGNSSIMVKINPSRLSLMKGSFLFYQAY